MKKRYQRYRIAFGLLAAFVLWTLAVCWVDVQNIGPQGSPVGFGSLNLLVHRLTGVHRLLYTITDWLGLVPLVFILGFAVLGLVQWVQRKDIRKVDRSLLVLGGFYLTVAAAYLFFESVIVNYRPVWIEGFPEASYPSSTTVLVLCVMPTAWMQLHGRIHNALGKRLVSWGICLFMAFMVVGRLISGVHWLTDILGGVLLSAGLVMLYHAATHPE